MTDEGDHGGAESLSHGFAVPASPIPFVPSGHFPLIRGIGLSQGGQGTGVTDCHVGPLGLLAMTGFFDSLMSDEFNF